MVVDPRLHLQRVPFLEGDDLRLHRHAVVVQRTGGDAGGREGKRLLPESTVRRFRTVIFAPVHCVDPHHPTLPRAETLERRERVLLAETARFLWSALAVRVQAFLESVGARERGSLA